MPTLLTVYIAPRSFSSKIILLKARKGFLPFFSFFWVINPPQAFSQHSQYILPGRTCFSGQPFNSFQKLEHPSNSLAATIHSLFNFRTQEYSWKRLWMVSHCWDFSRSTFYPVSFSSPMHWDASTGQGTGSHLPGLPICRAQLFRLLSSFYCSLMIVIFVKHIWTGGSCLQCQSTDSIIILTYLPNIELQPYVKSLSKNTTPFINNE